MVIQLSVILILKENQKQKPGLRTSSLLKKTYRSFINDVKPLYSQLDSEYVAAISKIEQCDFSQPIMALLPFLILQREAQQKAQQNIELYNKSQVLRKIIEERHLRYKY